jgi:hypothetical protein
VFVALALLGVALCACTVFFGPAAAPREPHPACQEHFKEVLVHLQAGERLQALTHAALICCEDLRARALRLCQDPQPRR